MSRKFLIALLFVVMFVVSSCSNNNEAELLAETERLQAELDDITLYTISDEKPHRNYEITNENETIVNEKTNRYLIWNMITTDILSMLRVLESAVFNDLEDVTFIRINDYVYEIFCIVSSKNAMGVMVTSNFHAVVLLDSDENPILVQSIEFVNISDLQVRIALAEEREQRFNIGQVYLTVVEFDLAIQEHPLFVVRTNYVDSEYFWHNDAMLQAILFNNSDKPIREALIGFVAWDRNMLPIKITQSPSSTTSSYFTRINYTTINLMPGEYFTGYANNVFSGMRIDGNLDVSFSRAIVISFEDFEGNIWNNPLLLDFRNLFEGRIMAQ